MPANAATLLGFDGPFLQKLERISLRNRYPHFGASVGPRRSPRRGSSIEFADFREYAPGDDFRRVDWRAYGRLDRLFMRLYTAEEITTLTLFVDRSASMAFGEPSKALFSARLAAIFAYVALRTYDLVAVAAWGEKLDTYHPPRGGEAAIPQVWSHIAALLPDGHGPEAGNGHGPPTGTDFTALRTFGHLGGGACGSRGGLSIVLSDVLTDSDWRAGIRGLRGVGQEVCLIQVLAPEELDPSIRGDWKLEDAETGRELETTVSARVLKRYREELDGHTLDVQKFCHGHDVSFLQLSSATSMDAVLRRLHREGLLA